MLLILFLFLFLPVFAQPVKYLSGTVLLPLKSVHPRFGTPAWCGAHLIITSRVIDFKGLRLAIYIGVVYFLIKERGNIAHENVTWYLIESSSVSD